MNGLELETRGWRIEDFSEQVLTRNKRVGELRTPVDRFELETRGWEN